MTPAPPLAARQLMVRVLEAFKRAPPEQRAQEILSGFDAAGWVLVLKDVDVGNSETD